jgi:DNA topoisomerase-2
MSRKALDNTTGRKALGNTTVRKGSGSVAAAMKKKSPKKKPDSDDEMIDYNDSPPAPARTIAPKRAARAAPKKYIEIPSDSDNGSDKDESTFDDD